MTIWVKRLLIANVGMFFLTYYMMPELFGILAFVPALVLVRPWTLVTYMFLHAGFGHLFFNMLALFFFGSRLEARLGERDFLLLYFISGIGGALLSFLFTPTAAVVGASGAVFGVLLGFALFWPRERIYIWAVLPIEARWLVMILAGMSLYSGFAGAGGRIAHFAHLGGFVAGWIFLRIRETNIRKRRGGPSTPTVMARVSGQTRREEEQWRSIRIDELHEINRYEVERIMRKMDVLGPQALSPDERAFMNRMVG